MNDYATTLEAIRRAATLKAIRRIPQQLIAVFTGTAVVTSLRTQYLPCLNAWPFLFCAENDHVWQVLKALEAVLDGNYRSFSTDKKGRKLKKGIFTGFVSLAGELQKDKGLVRQIWVVALLHDIAKSVRNADHAQIGGDLARDMFEVNDCGLTKQERERIAWIIGNHDVVGNVVSSAERAPRCLTDCLGSLADIEKRIRLNMLILLSFADLRGTSNGRFVNDDNARSRFWAADFGWLEQKERDLYEWREERLVRASTRKRTDEKRELWRNTFDRLQEETQRAIKRQFGKNIKVFTNRLYLALGLKGEELVKLFAVVSLMAEMATGWQPNPNLQVDLTAGAERDKPGPIIRGFKTLLKRIKLDDLTLAKVTQDFNGQTIYGIPISASQNKLIIDSTRIGGGTTIMT